MAGREDSAADVFALSSDAIVTMAEDGVILSWNPAAEALFGWSAEEAVGRPAAELLVPPRYREAHEEGLRQFRKLRTGPVLGKVLDHLEGQDRNGRHFPIELRISEAAHRPGGAIFVAFLRDISEGKR